MADENATKPEEKQFNLQKIYIRDVSFEAPNTPMIFTQEWKPEIGLQFNSEAKVISENVHEVVLSVTVTAKIGETTAYLIEVQQAGIFGAQGFTDEEMGSLLGAYCPNALYAFAREAISDLVIKGGFPQLLLAPINFDALYAQGISDASAQVVTPGQAQH